MPVLREEKDLRGSAQPFSRLEHAMLPLIVHEKNINVEGLHYSSPLSTLSPSIPSLKGLTPVMKLPSAAKKNGEDIRYLFPIPQANGTGLRGLWTTENTSKFYFPSLNQNVSPFVLPSRVQREECNSCSSRKGTMATLENEIGKRGTPFRDGFSSMRGFPTCGNLIEGNTGGLTSSWEASPFLKVNKPTVFSFVSSHLHSTVPVPSFSFPRNLHPLFQSPSPRYGGHTTRAKTLPADFTLPLVQNRVAPLHFQGLFLPCEGEFCLPQSNSDATYLTCFACRGLGHKATKCPHNPRPVMSTPHSDTVVTCAVHGKPRTSKNMFFNNYMGIWHCFQETQCKNVAF